MADAAPETLVYLPLLYVPHVSGRTDRAARAMPPPTKFLSTACNGVNQGGTPPPVSSPEKTKNTHWEHQTSHLSFWFNLTSPQNFVVDFYPSARTPRTAGAYEERHRPLLTGAANVPAPHRTALANKQRTRRAYETTLYIEWTTHHRGHPAGPTRV